MDEVSADKSSLIEFENGPISSCHPADSGYALDGRIFEPGKLKSAVTTKTVVRRKEVKSSEIGKKGSNSIKNTTKKSSKQSERPTKKVAAAKSSNAKLPQEKKILKTKDKKPSAYNKKKPSASSKNKKNRKSSKEESAKKQKTNHATKSPKK